jgi:hypothetical protein
MRVPGKRCEHCRHWFHPDPRTAAFQKFCPAPECRRQSRLASHRRWWLENGRELDEARASKHKDWARDTAYWRNYRADHPDYVRRDNERRRKAKKRALRAANQDMRREISVGKLRDILASVPEKAANQDMILRPVRGVVDYLLWKEGSANQDNTDPARLPA